MGMKVLVADDLPLMRLLIVACLRKSYDIEVIEAADGDQALALFAANHFDVVILDWEMPGKNGLDVVAAIRAEGSQVPIIMITAEAKTGRVLEAIRAGVSDYLVKPFDSSTLQKKLRTLVQAEYQSRVCSPTVPLIDVRTLPNQR
jgi:two-component system chemotaxis response regulator CheY